MSQQLPVKIRTATISDLPDILYIRNHTIETSTSDYRYDTISITELHRWYEERKTNNEPVFTAIMDELIVGYASY